MKQKKRLLQQVNVERINRLAKLVGHALLQFQSFRSEIALNKQIHLRKIHLAEHQWDNMPLVLLCADVSKTTTCMVWMPISSTTY